MGRMSRYPSYIFSTILILITGLLLGSCFAINHDLFNGVVTAKTLWVQMIGIVAFVFVGVKLFFIRSIKVSVIDVLVSSFVVCMVLREVFSEMPYNAPRQNLIPIVNYFGVYLFFRLTGGNSDLIKGIITTYLAVVVIQAVVGLHQLYGFSTSYHALFKITGTFHNPGPFSGFIVSGLPMALGLYFITKRIIKSTIIADEKDGQKLNWRLDSVSALFRMALKVVDRNVLLYYFSQLVIVVLLLVLPAARSRAAWLGGIIGSVFVLWGFRGDIKFYRPLTDFLAKFSLLKRRTLFLLGTALLVVSFYGVYQLKKGSADGRLLMWQVSWEMIKDKPLVGWGQGGFEANYGNYQAGWFRSGKGTKAQEMVAGSPDAPFNEVVRVWIGYGLIGLAFAVLVLVTCFMPFDLNSQGDKSLLSRNRFIRFLLGKESFQRQDVSNLHGTPNNLFCSKDNCQRSERLGSAIILRGGLLSILVFSIFSYSIDVAPIVVQVILLIGLIGVSRKTFPEIRLNALGTLVVSMVLVVAISFSWLKLRRRFHGYNQWEEAYSLFRHGVYSKASVEYGKALLNLANDGLLMQMYGKCLCLFEKWSAAKCVLHRATSYRSDYFLYCALGDCYFNLNEIDESENVYLHAGYIIPHRIYPRYLLVRLYDESKQWKKAKSIALELMKKDLKVESNATFEIIGKVKSIVEKYKIGEEP